MHPIERLRYVARAGDEDATILAAEAADALAALAAEPRALVTSCRRLIDAHPGCGPLWWVSARVLASADPATAARDAAELLFDDESAEELAGALASRAVIVTTLGNVVAEAAGMRPDVSLRYVGAASALRRALRSSPASDVTGWTAEEMSQALDGASLVVVEASVAGRRGIVVSDLAARLGERAGDAGIALWAVVPTGRLLPDALFDSCARRVGLLFPSGEGDAAPDRRADPSSTAFGFLASSALTSVVTSNGPGPPGDALARPTCPAPRELVRLTE